MKTGLFYGTGTEKTTFVANKIRKAFGEDQIDIIPIESAWKRDFEAYDHACRKRHFTVGSRCV